VARFGDGRVTVTSVGRTSLGAPDGPLRERLRARLPQGAGRRGFDVRNAAGPKATIRIYEEIGYWGITAEDFAAELERITAGEIEVQISSPGGDVFDGIAIFNALRAHPAKITTRVDGIAASAASLIVQAGDHRVVLEAGQLMIHKSWGLAVGNADEMREFADLLDRQDINAAGIYANRSGGDADTFLQLMAAETWMTDQESLDVGLVDEIKSPPRQESSSNDRRTDSASARALRDVLGVLDVAAARQVVGAFDRLGGRVAR
jgi:ATP-dependent protease ClpP protease subunit